jgi:hypothetical protein
LIYAEANVENRGPQTNPSSLYELVEIIQKDKQQLKSIEHWMDTDAPHDSDVSPLMEVTYIDKRNVFFTYARDKDHTRIYMKIYVLVWLMDMDIIK